MANEYKAFYLKDLLPLIDRQALVAMMDAHTPSTPNSSGMWDEANAHIAAFNDGVRAMTRTLRGALLMEDENDD